MPCANGGVTAKGERCPRVELVPASVEGHALDAALKSPGCWLRAGMGGTVTGLDMPQLLARLSDGVDEAAMRLMAQAAEGPVVEAVLEKAAQSDGGGR